MQGKALFVGSRVVLRFERHARKNFFGKQKKAAANPPELQDLYNVFSYVRRPEVTREDAYITALNCLKETALRQMILAKKRYGKTDGYIAWHGDQSFKPEEVTPQLQALTKVGACFFVCFDIRADF